MTLRRLRVLVDHLPREAATKAALVDGMSPEQWESLQGTAQPGWGQWSHTDLLLATVADRVAIVTWTLNAVNSEKGKAPPPPEPLPRPGAGLPPIAAAARERTKAIRTVAFLKAKQRAQGADPTDEQVEAVMTELLGGSVE